MIVATCLPLIGAQSPLFPYIINIIGFCFIILEVLLWKEFQFALRVDHFCGCPKFF